MLCLYEQIVSAPLATFIKHDENTYMNIDTWSMIFYQLILWIFRKILDIVTTYCKNLVFAFTYILTMDPVLMYYCSLLFLWFFIVSIILIIGCMRRYCWRATMCYGLKCKQSSILVSMAMPFSFFLYHKNNLVSFALYRLDACPAWRRLVAQICFNSP